MDSTAPVSKNPIREKINKIFDGHFIADSSEALNNISGFSVPSNVYSKRLLFNEIEKRDILVSKAVLLEYSKIKEKINGTIDSIKSLNSTVDEMTRRLHQSKQKTHHLICQTNKLKNQSIKTSKKIEWVNALIDKFRLCAEKTESNVLSSKSSLSLDFLNVLSHFENLSEDSKILVKCWYQTPALDIMEMISLQQEMAIEKLYHWTIGACLNIDSSNSALVPKALAKFQNRQVLFTNIVDEYCTVRKTKIVQMFIDALTNGTDTNKPIEFYANDPRRYINDILTWVYHVIPVEKENLTLLFKQCDIENKKQVILDALTIIVEALCPLLKVRVELILKPSRDPLELWSITNMLHYYKDVIQLTIPQGHLCDTFYELLKKSEEVFIASLDTKIQKELSFGVKAPSSDLTPSIIVTDIVSFLRDLLATMNVSNNINANDKKIVFSQILDPLMQAINETACHLSSSDMSVYMLNCIYHIQCTLSLYTMMDEYNERLQAQSEAQIDTLTSEQASYLVANLNLGPTYTILQEKIKGPLSAIPGLDSVSLKVFLNKFDLFLSSPDLYTLPQLNLLLSHTHKSTVKKRAFEVILAIYDQLYIAVHNPDNSYNDPNILMPKSLDDVKKLLK